MSRLMPTEGVCHGYGHDVCFSKPTSRPYGCGMVPFLEPFCQHATPIALERAVFISDRRVLTAHNPDYR